MNEAPQPTAAQSVITDSLREVGEANPWLAMAGMHDPNDPLIQEWKREMARYRQEIENDPDA